MITASTNMTALSFLDPDPLTCTEPLKIRQFTLKAQPGLLVLYQSWKDIIVLCTAPMSGLSSCLGLALKSGTKHQPHNYRHTVPTIWYEQSQNSPQTHHCKNTMRQLTTVCHALTEVGTISANSKPVEFTLRHSDHILKCYFKNIV